MPCGLLQLGSHFSGQLATPPVCLEVGGLDCAHKQILRIYKALELRKQAEGRLCGLLVGKRFSLVEREWDSQARESSLNRGPIVRRGRGPLHWYSSSGFGRV